MHCNQCRGLSLACWLWQATALTLPVVSWQAALWLTELVLLLDEAGCATQIAWTLACMFWWEQGSQVAANALG